MINKNLLFSEYKDSKNFDNFNYKKPQHKAEILII